MYEFYFDKYRLPITPEKVKTKINNNNKTIDLVNGGELNFIKLPGLTEYEFTFFLPQSEYPFADYTLNANEWIGFLEKKKTGCKPFDFKIIRVKPNGEALLNTGDEADFKVTLEDYSYEDDAKNMFDIEVNVKLKYYKEYKTKTINLSKNNGTTVAEIKEERPSNKEIPKSYTVKEGDRLWEICKQQLGDGAKYSEIAKLNGISNPNLIYPGQVIKIGS